MARPKKHHLDYFPKEVIHLSNRKIRRLLKKHDAQGYLVYEYLQMLIYGTNGYFLNLDKDLCFDVSDFLPESISEKLVEQVLNTCLELELFDNEKYQKEKILTSLEIQKIYITARKGKPELIKSYIIIDAIKEVFTEKTPVNDTKTPVLDSKTTAFEVKSAQKKRKEKKRKDNKRNYKKIKRKEKIKENQNTPLENIENNNFSFEKNNSDEQTDTETSDEEKEKSSAKKEKEIFDKCKAIFLNIHKAYYWQSEDDKQLKQILKMLSHSIQKSGTKQDLAISFQLFIENLPKYWREKKFTIPNLSRNYNEIINEIKQKYEHRESQEGTNEKFGGHSAQVIFDLAKNFGN